MSDAPDITSRDLGVLIDWLATNANQALAISPGYTLARLVEDLRAIADEQASRDIEEGRPGLEALKAKMHKAWQLEEPEETHSAAERVLWMALESAGFGELSEIHRKMRRDIPLSSL